MENGARQIISTENNQKLLQMLHGSRGDGFLEKSPPMLHGAEGKRQKNLSLKKTGLLS
jgi:hypothetical protein